jgi:hypothetical protein
MKISTDNQHEFILSTGRVIYAHKGIFGISDNPQVAYEGYDGHIDRPEYNHETEQEEHLLTNEERIEIA